MTAAYANAFLRLSTPTNIGRPVRSEMSATVAEAIVGANFKKLRRAPRVLEPIMVYSRARVIRDAVVRLRDASRLFAHHDNGKADQAAPNASLRTCRSRVERQTSAWANRR